MFRSLFGQIVLWFVVTILITASGVALIGAFSNSFNQRPSPSLFLSEAEYFYKLDGSPGVAEYLQRIRGKAGPEAFMTDNDGRDLVSDTDRARLVRQARRGWFPFVMWGTRFFFYEHDREGHWFFIESPPLWGRQWINRLWMLGVVIAFSYVLARRLTAPLRRLQSAVERFGQGDFSARVESMRRDEVGELSKTFNQMAERIQSLVASQRNLLRDISHELRSPLSRLSVAVELARSQPQNSKALDQIEKEGERLNTLVGEVLSLARTENVELTVECVPIDLNGTVQDLVNLCAIEAKQRKCRIVVDSTAEIIVNADGELLRRALENVVRNALRYAPAETDITIRLEATGDTVRIRIADRGPGVPAESLGRIFEPFYRVDQARNRDTGGTGLGLAIAKRAIESHSGEIHASNLNPGFEVEIILPRGDFHPNNAAVFQSVNARSQ
jgi:signal transduction histidine kinase